MKTTIDEIESKIHDIYAKVLGIDMNFKNDMPFIELGGQSISAMRLQIELLREFKVKVPLSKLFILDTVSKLSGMIYESCRSEKNDDNI